MTLEDVLMRDDGFLPKARYTSPDFAALEFERLWSRVWQVACRVEQVARPGDYVEYTIGDESVLVVGGDDGTIRAFHNTCLHRGSQLATDVGTFADGCIRCPYHAWKYALDGELVEIVDRDEFTNIPDGMTMHLRSVRVDTFGGFVFVNLDADAEPLADFLDPLASVLAPYHLERMRFRSYLTTIIDANWKAVVDAFNEGYHVQGLHSQILRWT
ncbi:MAG TPA: aromatic ring-hydroxylating dioxygenase subunit alpha, partial [Acidimicrobiia bacterium]|nr:aromatic ring-hydroxylating dioxygenase subunit alpha [Acidimicrobiia bacterium]